MSQMIEGPRKSFLAAAAIGANLRVKVSDATTSPPTIAVAGVSDPSIGTTEVAVLAAGPCTILLANAQGTRKMVCSDAITGGNAVYAAASGKVASTGTIVEGKAMESTTDNNDILEVLSVHNSDISTALTGTTGATFEVDTDLTKPKIALGSQTGGTGDFTTTLKPETTLSADNTMIVPEADGDTLVAVALKQTLTNKTLTSPVLTTPLIDDSDAGVTITSADQTHATPVVTIPNIGDAADEFVMKDTTQTLTGKTLTAPVFGGTARFGHTVTPVAAAGSSVADAAALGDSTITHITSDGAAKGVKLPAVTAAGVVRIVINNSATAAELYAESTGTVNGLEADASVVVPASKGLICISTAAKTWIAFDLTAAATSS